ncbi:MAG TPA: hypothetical protein VKX49_08245 [Bryobacteraceae bacterium]|nr:hypothetical protein [Bryobacteraceae bacterium]
MTEPPGAPTILIAEEDVGFLWWLGELFNELGYRSLPALSTAQALSLLEKSGRRADLLILNPDLKGARRLFETLGKSGSLKLVLIGGPEKHAAFGVEPLAVIEQPTGRGPISRAEWRQKLQHLLIEVGFRAAS